MKLIKLLTCTASFASLSLCASAQTGVIEVDFGGLRSSPVSAPTIVLSGSGVLGESLVGSQLYWVCLDNGQDAPANQITTYDISMDPSIMQVGTFASGGLDADARGAIVQATTNMFYAFQDQLMNTPGNEYASAFQRSVWAVTYGYLVWGQSGPLTNNVIDSVISNYDSFIQDEPLIEDFLLAALTTPTGDATVYFGNPTNDSSLQPIMLFPAVPEPSTLTLSGMLGFFLILRRRRN